MVYAARFDLSALRTAVGWLDCLLHQTVLSSNRFTPPKGHYPATRGRSQVRLRGWTYTRFAIQLWCNLPRLSTLPAKLIEAKALRWYNREYFYVIINSHQTKLRMACSARSCT